MKDTRRNIIFMIILLVSCLLKTGIADELDDEVRRISDQLRCPTCQNQSVKDSEQGLSDNMKKKIHELLVQGKSQDEILGYFEERYGEWILRSPKKEGFNLFLWLLPAAIILMATLLLIYSIRRRASQTVEEEINVPISESENTLFEKELRRIQNEE